MNFTKEQLEAINKSGTNIIVSAGAGSGKTRVLSERVLRILKEGTHINELLVLTFTNLAASEMKERIRKNIKKNKELINELDMLDSSYITTFDSFALSLVKKYHYLLNISPNVKIIDSTLISVKKNTYLDEILEKYYTNELFIKLINIFCTKDDREIKEAILNISNKLDLKVDKEIYLNNYINDYYSDNYINKCILEYEEIIQNKLKEINELIYELSLYMDSNYMEKLNDSLVNLLNSVNYDDIRINLNVEIPRLPNGTIEDAKKIKDNIKVIIDEIKKYSYYSKEELKNNILSTKEYVEVIINIIKELDEKINEFKNKNDVYEFNDIAKLSIKIVKENEDIRNELKNNFKEILIDEYQDTSDIQETFISLIENNNVYMVGDIKQSIYRFRNANPYIFKNKYDLYSKGINGYKIDMNKNFRSRREVLNNINDIFNIIMTDKIGGANYKESHNMIPGNILYEENKPNKDYNIEILEYRQNEYKKEEIEAFIICNDIKNKINNKYQIYDKEKNILRDIQYSDFTILMDRNSAFDIYKQIFTYNNIPLVQNKDLTLNDDIDINIIKNILKLIIKEKNNNKDKEYKYLFTSISRSFLYCMDDNTIYNIVTNNDFDKTELIIKIKEIIKDIDHLTPSLLLERILKEFNYYEKLIKLNDIESSIIRINKIKEDASNLESIGYSIEEYTNYLEELIKNGYEIKYNVEEKTDGVRIMNIHKSKGLEFPICYYSGLYKKFNESELKERFLYDDTYGIVTPFFNDGIDETIYKTLIKEKYKSEELSERIRLFYVGLTRAEEKMILINPYSDIPGNKIDSFKDIIDSVKDILEPYCKEVNIDDINLSENYKILKTNNINNIIPTNNIKISEKNINIDKEMLIENKYSKNQNNVIDNKTRKELEYGTLIHEEFELEDFKNPKSDKVKKFINNFDIEKSINIIKEYEFIDEEKHGIIDLLIEYEDYIDIIDYKTKNIEDESYIKQLEGYKIYIEKLTNKKVNTYLYSIMENLLMKV